MKKSTWISIIALLISIIGVLIALVAYFKRKRCILCDDFDEEDYDGENFDFFEDELGDVRDTMEDIVEDVKETVEEVIQKPVKRRGRPKKID